MANRELARAGVGRRGDRVVAFVGAIIGVVAGMAAYACLHGSFPGPLVVQAAVIQPSPPGSGAELSVSFFRGPGFTKTSADPHAFDLEARLWVAVPELTLVLLLAGAGGYAGWKAGGRLGRSRRGNGPAPASEAADYDDRVGPGPGAEPDLPAGGLA